MKITLDRLALAALFENDSEAQVQLTMAAILASAALATKRE